MCNIISFYECGISHLKWYYLNRWNTHFCSVLTWISSTAWAMSLGWWTTVFDCLILTDELTVINWKSSAACNRAKTIINWNCHTVWRHRWVRHNLPWRSYVCHSVSQQSQTCHTVTIHSWGLHMTELKPSRCVTHHTRQVAPW